MRIVAGVVFVGLVGMVSVSVDRADAQCAGDCNGDARVLVSELTVGVRMVLEGPDGFDCADRYDTDANGFVTVAELIAAVQHAVDTCPQCPPLDTAYATPCILSVTASCATGADLPLAGVSVNSDGETVQVELLALQPTLRFSGPVRNPLEADLGTFRRGTAEPVTADALLELSPLYEDGRQIYRVFLRSPQLNIDRCRVEQFYGAFGE